MNFPANPISYGVITDIQDVRTKSLLRGLLTHDSDATTHATYNNLRAATASEDVDKVSKLILCSPLFAHLSLPDDFPEQPPLPLRLFRPDNQSLHNEIVFQGVRICKNSERLKAALVELRALNDHLLADRAAQSVEAIARFTEKYGYSLLLLSKLAYARAKFHDQEDVVNYCNTELDKYGARRRSAITLAAIDMMRDSYDFLPLRRNLLEFANSKNVKTFTRDIVSWQFRPIRFIRNDLASRLQSHGLLSVIDALIFLFIHRFNVDILGRLGLNDVVDKYVPPSLREEWINLSEDRCPAENMTFDSDEPEFNDFVFYRRSIAWVEYKSVSAFRNAVDPLYLENTAKERLTNGPAVDFLKNYFKDNTKLSSIVEAPNDISISLARYENDRAGAFFRTLAFIHLMRSGARSSDVKPNDLLSLFNWTREISLIATADELRTFFKEQSDDLLATYLATALISDSSSLNVDQHRYRRALQKIVTTRFQGQIINFANYLFSKSKHVAAHLFETCTESFLVQLFFLLPKSEMVFETRAMLLDWYADAFDEPSARERAKTLRLDQRLRMVRGEIDDTRIYIDTIRFSQWLQDKLLDELSAALQGEKIDDEMIQTFGGFGDFAENQQPHVRLAIVLQAAFQEFCSNKRYGVDSYLGRRIRHGTLKGVMVAHLQPIFEKRKYEPLFANQNATQFTDNWLSNYDKSITYWSQEVFQVLCKQKSKGAFVTDITAGEKLETTKAALRDILSIFSETNSLGSVNQAIIEWCWRLIEKDLISIRMLIDSARINWGVISRGELQKHCPEELLVLAADLCREINFTTDEKFRLLGRWFTKPTNLAPSASLSLLLDAVLDEVKDHFPDYAPKIERRGLSDIELVGMYYHHVYDYLYVAIYNAAKHGNREGLLGQTIQLSEGVAPIRRLEIIISSQIAAGDSMDTVRSNIDTAMSGSTEDAMVVEGRSGLKKLLELSTDVREIEDIFVTYGEDVVHFHCVMNLPMS